MAAGGMDLKGAFKDKRFQLAAAVVGGAALITLFRRKKTGEEDANPTTPAGSTAPTGTYGNTGGTDLAGFLSSYSSQLDGRLREFAANQQDILDAINAGQTPGTAVQRPPATRESWISQTRRSRPASGG